MTPRISHTDSGIPFVNVGDGKQHYFSPDGEVSVRRALPDGRSECYLLSATRPTPKPEDARPQPVAAS